MFSGVNADYISQNYHNKNVFIPFSKSELALKRQSRTQPTKQTHLKKADFLSGR